MYDTGISLVNCHLSSGQNEGDSLRRHADYAEIMRRGAFPPDGQSTDLDVSLAGAQADQVLLAHQLPAVPDLGVSVSAQDVILLIDTFQQQSHFDRVLLLRYAWNASLGRLTRRPLPPKICMELVPEFTACTGEDRGERSRSVGGRARHCRRRPCLLDGRPQLPP